MEEAKAPVVMAPTTKKRPLDYDSNSNYFKIRAVIRDLRPHFIQVYQTPDYKNCKASDEIREQLKVVMKLYDNMKAEVVPVGKSPNMQDSQNLDHKTQPEQQPQVEKAVLRPAEGEDGKIRGTYVIGGSAFGWNFITFPGTDPVYYGRTKEQFRLVKMTE